MDEKKTLWQHIKNFTSHNTGVTIAFFITTAVVIWSYGCESQVQSLTNPTVMISRDMLNVEVDSLLATAGIRYAQLDRQDELKDAIFEHALLAAKGGGINPIGLLTTLAAITGIGATVDNVTKRRRENNALKQYVAYQKTRNP